MTRGQLLLIVALTNLALIIGLSLATALVKIRRERRARIREQELALLRPVVLSYLATWEEGNARDLADELIRHHAHVTSFEEVVAGLLPKLRGADRSVLVDILRRRGTVDAACRDTESWSSVRRYRAVELLGAAGVHEGVPFVTALLDDGNNDVRLAAVRALGRIGGLEAATALLAALDTDDAKIPPHPVTMALLRIGVEGTQPLLGALGADRVNVRTIAAEVLGVLGIFSAVPYLEHRLDVDPHPAARIAAAHALGRLDMPSSVPVLARALGDVEPEVLVAACGALGRITDPGSIPALERVIGHDVPKVRVAAAEAMVLTGSAGLARLRTIAQTEAAGGDAAREVLARYLISTSSAPSFAE